MKDIYEKFAFDYDEFGSIEDYLGDEKNFFDRIFRKHNVRTILDCACGTGQHLYMLSQLGYRVWGSDHSFSMLDVAKKNLQQKGQTIPLHQCDFRYLENTFNLCFDAIVCLTTSLPHLHSDDDLLMAVKSMKNRLNNGGLLVFTSSTTHYNLTLPPIEVVTLYTPCVQASNPVLQEPDNLETPISRNRSEMINPKPTNLRSQ